MENKALKFMYYFSNFLLNDQQKRSYTQNKQTNDLIRNAETNHFLYTYYSMTKYPFNPNY